MTNSQENQTQEEGLTPLREGTYAALGRFMGPIGTWLKRSGLKPNHVTWSGVTISVISAIIVMQGNLFLAGWIWFFGSALDTLDGAMARIEGMASEYGSFLDSTTDRISDGVMFAAIIYHFATIGEPFNGFITAIALVAGFLTSYARAKAESLGVQGKGGLVTRGERVFIIGIGLLADQLVPAMYIMVVLSVITVGQRMREAKQQLD